MKKATFFIIVLIGAFAFVSMGYQTAWEVPAKYKTMENPYAGQDDDDEIGLDLYETHCVSCHGEEGLGDGKKANTLNTTMRELTSDDVLGQTDGELYYKSYIGRDEMPNFEKKIKDEEERWLLINYIRALAE